MKLPDHDLGRWSSDTPPDDSTLGRMSRGPHLFAGGRLEDLEQVVQGTGAVVDAVRPDQLALPTPCSGWTVGGLLNHVVGVSEKVGKSVSGETDHPRTTPGDRLGKDWQARYWETAAVVVQGVRADPATLARTCYLPYGTFGGEVALAIYIFDVHVHGWDLATAIGCPYPGDERVASIALEVARLIVTPESRAQGQYAQSNSVAPGASVTHQLLAFTGRQPP